MWGLIGLVGLAWVWPDLGEPVLMVVLTIMGVLVAGRILASLLDPSAQRR